jgi:hypothetical protein
MSDLLPPNDRAHNPDVKHERSDVLLRPVLWFAGGMVVLGLGIHFALSGLFRYFERREAQPSQFPLAVAVREGQGPRDRLPPKPRLEGLDPASPSHDVGRWRPGTAEKQVAAEEALRYEWVDRDRGVVTSPVETAMQVLANKLPARPGKAAERGDEFLRAPSGSSSGRVPRGGR